MLHALDRFLLQLSIIVLPLAWRRRLCDRRASHPSVRAITITSGPLVVEWGWCEFCERETGGRIDRLDAAAEHAAARAAGDAQRQPDDETL